MPWLAALGAVVFLVSVCVAGWEHYRRQAAARRDRAWSDTETEFLGTRPVALDFCLDTGRGALPPAGVPADVQSERSAREAVLKEALHRMAKHTAEPIVRNSWADTQPAVSASPAKPPSAANDTSKPRPERLHAAP